MIKIERIEFPYLRVFIDNSLVSLHVQSFLTQIISTPSNPYLEILSPENFGKVYAQDNKLVWPQVLEATVCSGEVQKNDVVFSLKEIEPFLQIIPG